MADTGLTGAPHTATFQVEGLFDDAHGFASKLAESVTAMKAAIASNDEATRAQISDIRERVKQQRADRTVVLEELRLQLEDFVQRNIDKLLDDARRMRERGQGDDSEQSEQIQALRKDIEKTKATLCIVQGAWGKLVSHFLHPDAAAENFDVERAVFQNEVDRDTSSVLNSPRRSMTKVLS
mmetsp:Transcript_65309/g.142279  ORF Transcript_65309/g.142279 Transcript_65309/m.142279 type:complete len:181 (+) Transcript_65309:119-661(+)